MAEFLVEIYVSREEGADVGDRFEHARLAAEELTLEGKPVRYLHSIYVPEEEICFFLYEAVSVDDVREAAHRAALPFERVSEAVAYSKGVMS
jgi:hypothetical protein